MFLKVIIKLVSESVKDIKEGAEEITSGVVAYTQIAHINWGYEVVSNLLRILLPLLTAYIIHKLKKNYWEVDRPFFKNIIKDLKTYGGKKKN